MAFALDMNAFNKGMNQMADYLNKRQKYQEEPEKNTLANLLTQAKTANTMAQTNYRGAMAGLANQRAIQLPRQVNARMFREYRLANRPASAVGRQVFDYQNLVAKYGADSPYVKLFQKISDAKNKGDTGTLSQLGQQMSDFTTLEQKYGPDDPRVIAFAEMMAGKSGPKNGISYDVDPATGEASLNIGGSSGNPRISDILLGRPTSTSTPGDGSIAPGTVLQSGGMRSRGALVQGSDGQVYQTPTGTTLTNLQGRTIAEQNLTPQMQALKESLKGYPYYEGKSILATTDPDLQVIGAGEWTGANDRQKAAGDVLTRIPALVESQIKAFGLPATEGTINTFVQGLHIVPGSSMKDVMNRADVQLKTLQSQAEANQQRLLGMPVNPTSSSSNSPVTFTQADIEQSAKDAGTSTKYIVSALEAKYGKDGFKVEG